MSCDEVIWFFLSYPELCKQKFCGLMKNQATDLSYVTRNRHTAGVSNVDNLVWVNRIRKVLEMFKPCTEIKEDSTSQFICHSV